MVTIVNNENESALSQFKNLVYVSIISADNDEFGLTEDDKQEIIQRRKLLAPVSKNAQPDWEWILEPIKDRDQRDMLIKLFNEDEKD